MRLSLLLGSHRNAVDRRLEAAGMLLTSVLSELQEAHLEAPGDEIGRRRLELQARAIVHLVSELSARLLDLRSGVLAPTMCPHCGWARPTRSGYCARCSEIVAVPPSVRSSSSVR